MHLKKRIIAVAAILLLGAGILYGSTLKMRDKASETASFSLFDRKQTIYFWYDDENLSNYVNSAAVTFGEREDAHVIPVLVSGSEYLETINKASLEEEQMPDAYIISHDSLEKAYLAGLATEVEDAAGILNESHFPATALSAVSYRGKVVAYPLAFDTSALIYNETYLSQWAAQIAERELLEDGQEDDAHDVSDSGIDVDEEILAQKTQEYFEAAIPRTVDDILNIADTFDVPPGVEGVMEWDITDIFFNYWMVGNYLVVGGESGDDRNNISIDNGEAIACLEKYKELNQFFYIEAKEVNYQDVIRKFIDGKIVFTIATTDVVAKLEEAKENGEITFDYGVTTMPDVSDELKSRSMSVTDTVVINGYSKNKELANKFAAYLADECAGTLYEKTGHASAALGADTENGALQIFKLEYEKSVPLPKMMNTGNFWMLLERVFTKVWNDEDAATLLQELADIIVSQI